MMKKVPYIALGLIGLVVLAGLMWVATTGKPAGKPATNGKVNVVASFYPIAEFARQVGGEHVRVETLVKQGVEPHDYQPSPSDTASMYNAQVLVRNGAGLEPWAPKLSAELKKHGVINVDTSSHIKLQNAKNDSGQAAANPHVWLDPARATQQVAAIKEGLIAADPANRESYEQNAARYTAQLQALDVAFQKGLKQCAQHEVVTSHQSLGYVARHYGFTARSIAGLSPDDEPSPQELADVANFVRQYHVRYIFFEALISPKLAETIARETGAKTLTFNPLEGLSSKEAKEGKTYLSVQHDNLEALRTALDCK